MELFEILGYSGALLIGLILGLIGGGGSILTVPVLAYLFGVTPVMATAYSLFIVGTSSLVGALGFMRRSLVDFRTAINFAVPALIAVYLTRRWVLPAIPEVIFDWSGVVLTKGVALMLFFAGIMIMSAVSLIRHKQAEAVKPGRLHYRYFYVILEGLVVGAVTGLVGAGGGFLIVPALVLIGGLTMKKAVATSLLIIAIKSLVGFMGDIVNLRIDWPFLLIFTGVSMFGILIGTWLNQYIDGARLKKGFGWFVLVMGIFILGKELFW